MCGARPTATFPDKNMLLTKVTYFSPRFPRALEAPMAILDSAEGEKQTRDLLIASRAL